MQRDATFEVPLAAAHVGATETALRLDANALRSGLHGGRHGALHGTPEGNTTLELVGDAASEQRCVEFGVRKLDYFELDIAAGEVFETGSEPLGFRTAATNHHSRASGVDVDLDLLVTDPLDVDSRDGATGQFVTQVRADLLILENL